MNKIQKKLHSKEIENRKVKQKERKGTYYIQIDSKSTSGVSYTINKPLHKFGKIKLDGFTNEGWSLLINKANENLNKQNKGEING